MGTEVGEVSTAGVVGAGVMGAGIAQVLAVAGLEVTCHDVSDDALHRGRQEVEAGRYGLRRAVALGKVDEEQAEAALDRLSFTSSRDALATVDIVVEAVPEQLDLKTTVLRQLDEVARPDAILASNTSGFSISGLAAATDRPDRVVGWHWASPAPVMRLAEIVRAPSTSDATVAGVVDLAVRAGKRPIVVNDQPRTWGHVANRVYQAMVREARRVVDEGVATPDEVDQLLVDCYRFPVGPLAMSGGAAAGWR